MDVDMDLTAASATPLVLTVLAEGESHGYAILERVRDLSGGELEWPDGLVYPLFHRLRRLGYLTSEWRAVAEGRRRRYYALTDDGRHALAKRSTGRAMTRRRSGGAWRVPGGSQVALGHAGGTMAIIGSRPSGDSARRLRVAW